MAITSAENLRSDVLVTALASRLADLQNSRIDGTTEAPIIAPTTAPEAGRRALIAGQLLAALETRIDGHGTGFAPLGVICDNLINTIPNLSLDELRFVSRFLDVDREIRYQDVDGSGALQEWSTRGWSRLVRYQPRYDRIKLTDAGRLWIRVLRHREHWLFEDKEIEKLVVAISGSLFEQITPIAIEAVNSIRLFSETLTAILESPSFDELSLQYTERRDHFSGVIDRCHISAMSALELLQTDTVITACERWRSAIVGDTPSLAQLYERVSRVHRATESLRRSWASLLDAILENRRPMIGIIRFDLALDRYLSMPSTTDVDRIFLDGIAGWGSSPSLFSGTDIVGSFPEGVEPEATQGPVFNFDDSQARQQVRTWLATNRTALLNLLSDEQPKRLFDLFDADLAPSLATLAAAFGTYVIADPLGAHHRIIIEHRIGNLMAREVDHRLVTVSDVTIRLKSSGAIAP